ncbi:DUF1801 domain-containing protein [Cohnella rhizosphaerae]|uniref:DUF1801 domain-containing protein n=1 Tax=Cohnella rhizosphaerae TaxID=1457232 RepID=A0A9X4L5X7_9BACL|nr:DUF1801 domain-containing protein [Cohnella rhizosphaerae]MDG0814087.1 DUF1801 domain-containing protein [Cohnella rhizosphaerae]
MNPEVAQFIADLKEPWQAERCNALRELTLAVIPDALERMQYKKPHYLKNGKYAAVISTSKDAVSYTVFNAAGVAFPEGAWSGPPERKTIKIGKAQDVDKEALADLLRQASAAL